jgi:hypothetical protein
VQPVTGPGIAPSQRFYWRRQIANPHAKCAVPPRHNPKDGPSSPRPLARAVSFHTANLHTVVHATSKPAASRLGDTERSCSLTTARRFFQDDWLRWVLVLGSHPGVAAPRPPSEPEQPGRPDHIVRTTNDGTERGEAIWRRSAERPALDMSKRPSSSNIGAYPGLTTLVLARIGYGFCLIFFWKFFCPARGGWDRRFQLRIWVHRMGNCGRHRAVGKDDIGVMQGSIARAMQTRSDSELLYG